MPSFCIPNDEHQDILVDDSVDAQFLDLANDDELQVTKPIVIKGRIYRTSEWLIIDASIRAVFNAACPLCNDSFELPVEIASWNHQQLISDVDGQTWDITEALRESILIEVPFFAQCGGSSCKNYKEVEPFIRADAPEECGHQPFAQALSTLEV
jgi:hypothetical protein